MLRQAGHDVATAVEGNLSRADDPIILAAAAAEYRILLTFDLDFADVREYPVGTHAGIVVFRLHDHIRTVGLRSRRQAFDRLTRMTVQFTPAAEYQVRCESIAALS